MSDTEKTVDVLVVGSGAAAMTAAVAAADAGLSVLMTESTDKVGGSTAMSGGGAWLPNNHVMKKAGITDSPAAARTYMDAVIRTHGPASTPQRRDAFVRTAPEMAQWLDNLGFSWVYAKGYSDYHPEEPGGSVYGRALEGAPWDIKKLHPRDRALIRPGVPIPMHTFEVSAFMRAFVSVRGFLTAANIIGVRTIGGRLTGKHLMTCGQSMIAQLLHLARTNNVTVWTDAPLLSLTTHGDRVTGAHIERRGQRVTVTATHGVIIGAGGFAHNADMREQYGPHPASTEWTSANPGDQGLPIRAAQNVGAATDLMHESWWGPTALDPATGTASFLVSERSWPHSMIVDANGRRFMNESASYVDCGHAQYEHNKNTPAIPAWMIMESRHRNRYPFGFALPRMTPKKMIESGFFVVADTLEELATKIGVDTAGLTAEAKKFSEFAETGKDLDFHRGDSAYDHVYGDPAYRKNPNLGAITKGPFYATKIYPGDLGTKGGIVTDEHARALREDGSVIEGLYAAGNSSASVMGDRYPGPGSTIGPAMVFGYLAGRHVATRAHNRDTGQHATV